MNTANTNPEQKDKELWKMAKKRASFKKHLLTYFIVNIFLWGLWFFQGKETGNNSYIPWPAWVTLGWGVGLAFNYMGVYNDNAVEKEYQKLKNNQS